MANFVLTKIAPGIWTGSAVEPLVVSVRSENHNSSKMHDAAYPDGAPIAVKSGTASFKILDDGNNHSLTVAITPPVPVDNWSIVEVGKDGSTQSLLDLAAGQPVGAVLIVPK